VAALTSDASATQASIDAMFRDQERLRENLKALGTGAQGQPLRARYLDQLKAQEDQIQTLRARIDAVNTDIAAAQARLADLIATFAFGG
jgi:hypothetical protein